MAAFLSSLTFLNPWLLSGLIFLPALWFLLRVVPPASRYIYFPAARFLEGLKPDSRTSSSTPWWILLLRLLTIAFLIIALARPVSNPDEALPGSGAIRIVMDNGWEAAQNWRDQVNTAESLLGRAEREKRAVFFMTTAPEPGKDSPLYIGPVSAGEAESALRGLAPFPGRQIIKPPPICWKKAATKRLSAPSGFQPACPVMATIHWCADCKIRAHCTSSCRKQATCLCFWRRAIPLAAIPI